MLNSFEETQLHKIIQPKSIAFFGASNNFSSMGSTLLNGLQALGYKGRVYPIHLKENQIRGLKAYQSIQELPEIPDLAIIILPTRIVNQTMEECGRKGIKQAIVVSAGFKEVGDEGLNLEKELKLVAEQYNIRFLGPNCIGVANPHHKLNTTPFHYHGTPGFIGIASQSGSFVTQMFDYLKDLGLGFSKAFSVGNELNTDVVDCMAYLGDCPHTRVIALYLEGITRGRAFLETARAIVPHKPIVAYYVGGSGTGKRASLSHTGALSGPDALYDGMFRQCGVIRAQSITELFDFCWVLGNLPMSEGNKVIVQTHSGGPGAAAADFCERAGLQMPPLSPEMRNKLIPLVPGTAGLSNPVDLTFFKNPEDYLTKIPKILLRDQDTDMLLIYTLFPAHLAKAGLMDMGMEEDQADKEISNTFLNQSESLASLIQSFKKPIAGFTASALKNEFIEMLIAKGIPVFPSPERAAKALAALAMYSGMRKKFP